MSVLHFLQTNTFSSLLATKPKLTKKPLVLEHNMTLRDALAALRKHGFLGAPLFIYPTLGGDTFGEGLMDVTERPTYCGWCAPACTSVSALWLHAQRFRHRQHSG